MKNFENIFFIRYPNEEMKLSFHYCSLVELDIKKKS